MNGLRCTCVGTDRRSPQYHACSNGLVERMVQTVKRSVKIWTPDKGNLHSFIQKVLLTYRSSRLCSKRGDTPAALMLGRELRTPLISFHTPNLIYTQKPGCVPERCLFLVQQSPKTCYVDCNGTVRLAHVDQLRQSDEEPEEEAATDQSSDETNAGPQPSSGLRRSTRLRRRLL